MKWPWESWEIWGRMHVEWGLAIFFFFLDMLRKIESNELEALQTCGLNSRYEEIVQGSYL